MTKDGDRLQLFDAWAADYDGAVYADGEDGFPFAGYERVLDAVARRVAGGGEGTMRILDVGVGTGNLAAKFSPNTHDVWGVDFSPEMLRKAAERLPHATLLQADLLQPLPEELRCPFDRIVSGYVLHEFDLATKIRLLERLAEHSLAPGGLFVIGDIAFPDADVLSGARDRWHRVWDFDEHYWAADEALAAFRALGWEAEYEQISICAGVFVINPRP